MIKRKKVCSHCNTAFITSKHNQKYCNSECRRSANKKERALKSEQTKQKKIARRKAKLPVAHEWLWVANECKRAGTVEILKGVDLAQLFDIYQISYKYNGYDPTLNTQQQTFDKCHIAPVKHESIIGCLHHKNLFIGRAKHNQRYSNKWFKGSGVWIEQSELQEKWLLGEKSSNRFVLDKVAKYLGPILDAYLDKNPVKVSSRFSIINNILEHSNKQSKSDLMKLTTKELREIKANFQGKTVYSPAAKKSERSLIVYHNELKRLSVDLPEGSHKDDCLMMAWVLKIACCLMMLEKEDGFHDIWMRSPYWHYQPFTLRVGKRLSTFRDWVSITAFETLQGKPLDKNLVIRTLKGYLEINTGLRVTVNVPEGETPYADDVTQNAQGQWMPKLLESEKIYVQNIIRALSQLNLISTHRYLQVYFYASRTPIQRPEMADVTQQNAFS